MPRVLGDYALIITVIYTLFSDIPGYSCSNPAYFPYVTGDYARKGVISALLTDVHSSHQFCSTPPKTSR